MIQNVSRKRKQHLPGTTRLMYIQYFAHVLTPSFNGLNALDILLPLDLAVEYRNGM